MPRRPLAEPFERTALAVSHRTELRQADMPQLAGVVVRPGVELAVENQPGAESGAERQKHHVLSPDAGAELPLGQRARVRVVMDSRPDPETFFEHPDDRNIVPPGQVRRRHDHASLAVERPAATDPNRARVRRVEAVPAHHLLDLGTDVWRSSRRRSSWETSPFRPDAAYRPLSVRRSRRIWFRLCRRPRYFSSFSCYLSLFA